MIQIVVIVVVVVNDSFDVLILVVTFYSDDSIDVDCKKVASDIGMLFLEVLSLVSWVLLFTFPLLLL